MKDTPYIYFCTSFCREGGGCYPPIPEEDLDWAVRMDVWTVCLTKRETSWRDVVAADGLQALLTRLPSSLLSVHPLRKLSSDGADRWISPAFFGEARWSAINWSRQVLSTSGHASLGRRRKKRVKSASILLHARGEGGSSFDENCFRPRFDQLFLSDRPLLNSSFNLALPVPFKGQINYFEISISSGKSGKFYEREKYIS